MSQIIVEREEVVAVADAIRSKTNTTASLSLGEMASNVNNIATYIEETDPTVPAWAKQPNPPTAAEIGAAPAGFGLGVNNLANITDANEAIDGGMYATNSATLNTPLPEGVLVVLPRRPNETAQLFYSISQLNLIAVRCHVGKWQPWEWVNPPMQQGVEYRTTERWGGFPVYTQLVHFGYAPNNSFKEKSINTNVFRLVSLQAHANTEDGRTWCVNDIGTWSISNGNLRLETTSDKSAFYCYATIKYIKA